MINFLIQAIIFVLSGLGLLLVTSKKPRTRFWGFLVTLVNQPFWLVDNFVHKQWGMVMIAFVYVIVSIIGMYQNIKTKKKIKVRFLDEIQSELTKLPY